MRRVAVCAVMFLASGLIVSQRVEPAAAQEKKQKDTQLAQLRQRIDALKQDVNQLKDLNNKLQAENNRLEGLLKKGKKDDKADDKTIKDLRSTLDGFRGAGLVHVVVLKLKPDSESKEVQALIDDAYAQLTKIKTVRGLWAGKPASKATPDASGDYTVALALVFDDAAALKSYLNDSVHTKFADKHLKKWETPVVYDFEPKKLAP